MLSLDQLTHLGGPFLHILLTTLDTAQAGDGVFVITLKRSKTAQLHEFLGVKWASFGRSKHDQVLISFPNLFGGS